jgi:hypothetical protein
VDLTDFTDQVREFINHPRVQPQLLRDRGRWAQIVSCLDLISDTVCALRAYKSAKPTDDHGFLYLASYGAFQALLLQQDAAKHLCDALGLHGVDLWSFDGLAQARRMRHRATGHPTKLDGRNDSVGRKAGVSPTFHGIIQNSLGIGGFELWSFNAGDWNRTLVDVTELIADQQRDLSTVLGKLVAMLKEQEEAHRTKFRHQSLERLFPDLLYAAEKIGGQIRGTEPAGFGKVSVDLLRKALSGFQDALKERGVPQDDLEYLAPKLDYALSELAGFLTGGATRVVQDPDTAEIFAHFVCAKMGHLKDIAREIDAEYGSKPG